MRRKNVLIAIGLILSVFVLTRIPSCTENSRVTVVTRIVDGDTVEIMGGQKIRLIGVDTPELRDPERNRQNAKRLGIHEAYYAQYSREATEFLKDLVLHQDVRLEYDDANAGNKHRDKYGRLLAYLWIKSPFLEPVPDWVVVSDDPEEEYSISLNASLVKAGYSMVYTRFPFKYRVPYQHYELDAREKKRGFWQGQNRSIIKDAQN